MLNVIVFLGVLSAYGLYPTVAQTEYQQNLGNLPEDLSQYDVLLAVDHCGLIGHEATMYVGEEEQAFSAIIYDCAGGNGAHFFSDGDDLSTPYLLAADADWFFWQEYPDIVHSVVRIEVEVVHYNENLVIGFGD